MCFELFDKLLNADRSASCVVVSTLASILLSSSSVNKNYHEYRIKGKVR